MKKISIIIPTYNRPDRLKRCLKSIVRQKFPKEDFEVIIIDDGSEQDNKSVVDEFCGEMDLAYMKRERKGPAASRNEGLKNANASIVAFTDDDCVLDEGWLSAIHEGFERYPEVSCLKGKTLAFEPSEFARACEKYIYGSKKSHATNNIAYRKEIFDDIGGFDTRYRDAAGEDVDLKWRFLQAGYKRLYLENMVACHPHEDSMPLFKNKCYRVGNGLGVFVKKYIFKRPLLAIGAFIYDVRYLPLSWYFLLFKKESFSPLSLRAVRSALILKGFLGSFRIKGEKR
jgi:glycosyltransferase involved in cell wall biosynthesis